jgi:hypothetical protein
VDIFKRAFCPTLFILNQAKGTFASSLPWILLSIHIFNEASAASGRRPVFCRPASADGWQNRGEAFSSVGFNPGKSIMAELLFYFVLPGFVLRTTAGNASLARGYEDYALWALLPR